MFPAGMPNRGNHISFMRNSVSIGCLLFLWLCAGSIASAQTNPPGLDQFSPNPLEITTPDPLKPVSESLSNTQRDELTVALEQLSLEAAAKLQAGDGAGAFDIWFRELRLRRYLGPAAEIAALSRVGSIAWSSSKTLNFSLLLNGCKQFTSKSNPNYQLILSCSRLWLRVFSRCALKARL